MMTRLAPLAALLTLSMTAPAFAAGPIGPAGAAPMADLTVYKAFHEKAGIDRVVAGLIAQYPKDKRIADIFKASDLPHLQVTLSEQICFILGGPCAYTGKSMTEAHKDVGLQDADFNALVEDLQNSMDKEKVPFWAQNKLLAKLAPMRRAVVVR